MKLTETQRAALVAVQSRETKTLARENPLVAAVLDIFPGAIVINRTDPSAAQSQQQDR
jgi:hypothetical protein